MSTTDIERLRSIKSFPSLIKYLRDDLDWPIEVDDFEEMTFDYEPEELGIDPKAAAKIEEIKQLRPLVTNQPWGIFFIKFEPKRLPVVVLRRILSQLVIKKRASSRPTDRASWHLNDLLFVSNYGEGDQRQITFAHFAQNETNGDLPTLKVLGWDDADTVLHLADAHHTLVRKLRWPDNEFDLDRWREEWSSAFTLRHREVITTTEELEKELASLAKIIRQRATTILERESDRGPLCKLYAAFKEALIHDLTEDDFADVLAQSVTYGLLAAWLSRSKSISVKNFIDMIPPTNPFLRELLGMLFAFTGRKGIFDFDELGIQDVIDLLNHSNAEAVKADIGKKTQSEDPVIHFYEHFLAAYDKKKKVQRGVFYTPQPVVSYIVRSVHELLQTEFGIEDGLASTVTWGEMAASIPELKIPEGITHDEFFVNVLDPATGTATFLVEIIEVIFNYLKNKWSNTQGKNMPRITTPLFDIKTSTFKDYWNAYVPQCLLPRLYGYELMMAPYIIAHMKIGLKLSEINVRLGQPDYQFQYKSRAHIYLTNSLEPPSDKGQQSIAGLFPALAHEAEAVNVVKAKKRFMVIIGNPPYSGHSANFGEWITKLVDDYYFVDGSPLGEKNPKWLQDDYVKFIKYGQFCIAQSGTGVFSYVTNHGYIDNPTFRGMRQNFQRSFSSISVLDLHGNATKKERAPDGSDDVNVFDIKQGVAIFTALRLPNLSTANIKHCDLFGSREYKYDVLLKSSFSSLMMMPVRPSSSFYLFIPQNIDVKTEYDSLIPITSAMPINVLGFQTHRDHFAVDFEREVLMQRIADLRDNGISDADIRKAFNIVDNRDWQLEQARLQLRANPDWESPLTSCSYRPFDVRSCYFSTIAMDYPRRELLDHVAGKENLCLGLGRQGIAVQDSVWSLISVSRYPVDANIFRRGGINIFPLYLYPKTSELDITQGRYLNFSPDFLDVLSLTLSLTQKSKGEMPADLKPEDVLNYVYATFHSLSYRIRYAEFLRIDFPRLPLTTSLHLFGNLARLGGELVSLHLMESPKLDSHITTFVGGKQPEVEKVSYYDEIVWIDKAKTTGFGGVPEGIWNFHIGGYQVCEKWLKDRKGRTLSEDDINHYHRIVVALSETIRIMAEIDKVIDAHGGWPEAFTTNQ